MLFVISSSLNGYLLLISILEWIIWCMIRIKNTWVCWWPILDFEWFRRAVLECQLMMDFVWFLHVVLSWFESQYVMNECQSLNESMMSKSDFFWVHVMGSQMLESIESICDYVYCDFKRLILLTRESKVWKSILIWDTVDFNMYIKLVDTLRSRIIT